MKKGIIVAILIFQMVFIFHPNDVDGEPVQISFDDYRQRSPSFSPDDSKIVYSSSEDGGGYRDIWIMNADGSNHIQLTDNDFQEDDPSYDPSGDRIVFSLRGSSNSDIWVMDSDGSDPKPITDGQGKYFDPSVSPDGKSVICSYIEPDGDYASIVKVSIDGFSVETLAYDTLQMTEPVYSPDGNKIAYLVSSDDISGRGSIWIMDSDGNNRKKLVGNWDGWSSSFVGFHPYGEKILFTHPDPITYLSQIYCVNIDGSNRIQLTAVDTNLYCPTFNHAGNLIVYSSFEDDGNHLDMWTMEYMIPPDTIGKPSPPSNIQFNSDDDFINITWDDPLDTGNLSVLRYIVSYSPTGDNENWYKIALIPPSEQFYNLYFSYNESRNGSVEYFRVATQNGYGLSDESDTIEFRVIFSESSAGEPSQPRYFRATNEWNYIELTWDEPKDKGRSEIIKYTICRSSSDLSPSLSFDTDPSTFHFKDMDVENNVTYEYLITASNEKFTSVYGNRIKITFHLDRDKDGTADNDDAFIDDPTQWNDTDGDGYGDNPDGNNPDQFPTFELEWNDTDGDGHGDNGDVYPDDPSEWYDHDNDGVGDNADAFPFNSTEWSDTDGDGCGDNSDIYPDDPAEWKDSDNDDVGDNADAFPEDASEWEDSDGDGIGDNADAFPEDASEWEDSDGDGIGDNADLFMNDANEWNDTDSDGHGDNSDAFPSDAFEWEDSDSDGVGDNSDAYPFDPERFELNDTCDRPLMIVSHIPNKDEVIDNTDIVLMIEFSKKLDTYSLEVDDYLMVEEKEGMTIEGIWEPLDDPMIILFVPNDGWTPGKSYRISVSGAIYDVDDLTMGDDCSWNFSVAENAKSIIDGYSPEGNVTMSLGDFLEFAVMYDELDHASWLVREYGNGTLRAGSGRIFKFTPDHTGSYEIIFTGERENDVYHVRQVKWILEVIDAGETSEDDSTEDEEEIYYSPKDDDSPGLWIIMIILIIAIAVSLAWLFIIKVKNQPCMQDGDDAFEDVEQKLDAQDQDKV